MQGSPRGGRQRRRWSLCTVPWCTLEQLGWGWRGARRLQEEGSADAVSLGRATRNVPPASPLPVLCPRSLPGAALSGQERGGSPAPCGSRSTSCPRPTRTRSLKAVHRGHSLHPRPCPGPALPPGGHIGKGSEHRALSSLLSGKWGPSIHRFGEPPLVGGNRPPGSLWVIQQHHWPGDSKTSV